MPGVCCCFQKSRGKDHDSDEGDFDSKSGKSTLTAEASGYGRAIQKHSTKDQKKAKNSDDDSLSSMESDPSVGPDALLVPLM
jgi:hypothetical protein